MAIYDRIFDEGGDWSNDTDLDTREQVIEWTANELRSWWQDTADSDQRTVHAEATIVWNEDDTEDVYVQVDPEPASCARDDGHQWLEVGKNGRGAGIVWRRYCPHCGTMQTEYYRCYPGEGEMRDGYEYETVGGHVSEFFPVGWEFVRPGHDPEEIEGASGDSLEEIDAYVQDMMSEFGASGETWHIRYLAKTDDGWTVLETIDCALGAS